MKLYYSPSQNPLTKQPEVLRVGDSRARMISGRLPFTESFPAGFVSMQENRLLATDRNVTEWVGSTSECPVMP